MDASGNIPLPPMPLKKTGESIIGVALLGHALNGQPHAACARMFANVRSDERDFWWAEPSRRNMPEDAATLIAESMCSTVACRTAKIVRGSNVRPRPIADIGGSGPASTHSGYP